MTNKATQNVVKLDETLSARADFGIFGNGSDETTKILAAVEASRGEGKALVFARPDSVYRYESPLALTDGMRLEAEGGATNRWRSTVTPVQLDYRGSGAAVTVTPGANAGIDSVQIVGLQFDGSNAAPTSYGLYLNASATNSYIEGVNTADCTFQNFPVHQVYSSGTVFDVCHYRLNLINPGRVSTGDDLVRIVGGQPSQWTFDDCFLSQYTDTKWCVFSANGEDVRFIGGTINAYGFITGANGVVANGGLFIYGTHVEGCDPTQTTNIGIQYLGSNGAFISPSQCALFGVGTQIGDGTTASARGWTIAGSIGNNNTAVGGYDLLISGGGPRAGTVLAMGNSNTTPTIVNNRKDIDGVDEVLFLNAGRLNGMVQATNGTLASPSVAVGGSTQGLYNTGSGVGVAVGGSKRAEFRSGNTLMTLPTSDPGISGALWIDTAAGRVIKVSA